MQRTIKSYVLRAGRISPRQQYALQHWLSDYLLEKTEGPWSLNTRSNQDTETIVEIGFGMGDSLIAMAKEKPHLHFIGIEVHLAGIGSLVAALHDNDMTNVQVAPYDAVEVFKSYIPDNTLSGVQIFFPDPWPKKRHHKRRLIQPPFIKLLTQKIKVGGFIHCATDWHDYALQMEAVLNGEAHLVNQAQSGGFSPRPESRPLTKFEQRGKLLGHGVWDLIYTKIL